MTTAPASPPRFASPRVLDAIAIVGMTIGVLVLYLPFGVLKANEILKGGDYAFLHQRRIEFARAALFGPHHTLPAWYPRELLGTPFWSNVQSFPFIPTRLVLLAFDTWHAYVIGVNLAATLAAIFTYLFCRSVGLGRIASACTGWTFIAAGFFASRVLLGHLPLLEAYPALPILLWLIERYASSETIWRQRNTVIAIGLSTACIFLAGHPQIPLYAAAAATIYAVFRLPRRRLAIAILAMGSGLGVASFALWPMVELIGRSTRVLALDRAENDIPFPLWRWKAFLFPWADGWPAYVKRSVENVPFTRASKEYFLDTVSYVGWLPALSVAGLILRAVITRRLPDRRWVAVVAIGVLALVTALPMGSGSTTGWTLLRSPSRQIYLTTFALVFCAGAAIHVALDWASHVSPAKRPWLVNGTLAIIILSAIDVGSHAKEYVTTVQYPASGDASMKPERLLREQRNAIEHDLTFPINPRIDDVGGFDSILLNHTYQALSALAGWAKTFNVQVISGPDLGVRALTWAGVSKVIPKPLTDPPGLKLLTRSKAFSEFAVPAPMPRAGFVPESGAMTQSDAETYDAMRRGLSADPAKIILSAEMATPKSAAASNPSVAARGNSVRYLRPTSDEITLNVEADEHGYVRVLESWDPGWHATIDQTPAEVLRADGFVMAVPVSPGRHVVRLTYATPGALTGIILSAIGLISLTLLAVFAPCIGSPRMVSGHSRDSGAAA